MRHAAFALACLAILGLRGAVWAQTAEERDRRAMVERQIVLRGVCDTAVLRAMLAVPRHEFVPADLRGAAYADHPVPIGYGQTVSQPYIVAYMTEALGPLSAARVLEVGTGSGYQAAILAELARQVYTIEIIGELADSAGERLRRLGFGGVLVRHGDGFYGWPEGAPFDAIIVTAAAGFVPPPLLEQLKPGGRMVVPVGTVYGAQNLVVVDKAADGSLTTRTLLPVRFVPLTGAH